MNNYAPRPGFPNWRNSDSYPNEKTFIDPEDETNQSRGWAWEFLRRNRSYQEAFDESAKQDSNFKQSVATSYGLSILLPYSYSGETCLAMFQNSTSLRQFDNTSPNIPQLDENQIGIIFDLRFPLEPQIAAARLQIAEKAARSDYPLMQRSHSRKRFDAYTKYLRVLDAKSLNVRSREIADQFICDGIFPREGLADYVKQIDKYNERATDIANSGYRKIAYTEQSSRQ